MDPSNYRRGSIYTVKYFNPKKPLIQVKRDIAERILGSGGSWFDKWNVRISAKQKKTEGIEKIIPQSKLNEEMEKQNRLSEKDKQEQHRAITGKDTRNKQQTRTIGNDIKETRNSNT